MSCTMAEETSQMARAKQENERRRKYRFPIERELRYKMADHGVVVATGAGKTLDMGSGGVAFTAEQQLTPGAFVELSVSCWCIPIRAT